MFINLLIMKLTNNEAVTAIKLAAALGKSVKTAQRHLREIRKKAGKVVAMQFVTVANCAAYYNMPLLECYLWLKMTPP